MHMPGIRQALCNRVHCLFPDSHLGWGAVPSCSFQRKPKDFRVWLPEKMLPWHALPSHTLRKPTRAGETLLLLDAALLLQGCSCHFSCKQERRLQTLQTGSTRDCSNLACHDPQELRTVTFHLLTVSPCTLSYLSTLAFRLLLLSALSILGERKVRSPRKEPFSACSKRTLVFCRHCGTIATSP